MVVRMSRTVELLDRGADPLGRLGVADAGQRALQAQAGGEDPLDDVVVQVAGDPVAVLDHVGPADGLLPGGEVQRQRGLIGECLGEANVFATELARPAIVERDRALHPTAHGQGYREQAAVIAGNVAHARHGGREL